MGLTCPPHPHLWSPGVKLASHLWASLEIKIEIKGALGGSLLCAASPLSQAAGGSSLSARAELCRWEAAGRKRFLLSWGLAQGPAVVKAFPQTGIKVLA